DWSSDVCSSDLSHQYADIDPAAFQVFDDVVGSHLHHREGSAGMLFKKRVQKAWQEIRCQRRDDAQPEFTVDGILLTADKLFHVLDFLQDLAGAADDNFAGRRGFQWLTFVKNPDPEFTLELLHHHAERRLGHVTMVCGPGVVAMDVKCDDIFQLLKVHGSVSGRKR